MPRNTKLVRSNSGTTYESIMMESYSEPRRRESLSVGRVCVSIMYGFVATAMTAPVMMSFASIIFSNPFFR